MKSKVACISRRCSSVAGRSFVGKSLVKLKELTCDDIKSLIWTAIDLKIGHEGNPTGRTGNPRKLTLLMKEPQMDLQIPAHEAAARLNASFKVIVDPDWDVQVFMGDTASYLGLYSDVILCQGKSQSKIQSMQGACPIVNLESRSVTLCKLLTHLMTLQLHYGRLRGLNLAWVGPPTALLNTYLCTAPYFGINICFSCSHCKDKMISPVKLHEARGICQKTRTKIRECEDCQTAVASAHVVLTSRHNEPEMKISLQSLEKAQPDWSVLCSFPRGRHEIDTEVINHRNSLVWAAADNTQWMIMALVLRLLQDHKHQIEYPDFDKITQLTEYYTSTILFVIKWPSFVLITVIVIFELTITI